MGSCSHRFDSPVGMSVTNQGISRRELEAVYLTESSVVLHEYLTVRLDFLGETGKDQENLPGENYIS